MKEYLIIFLCTWVFKTIVDIGIKYSKTTENTFDDLIFKNLKDATTVIFSKFKKK